MHIGACDASLREAIAKLNWAWQTSRPNGQALFAAGIAARKLKDTVLAQKLF